MASRTGSTTVKVLTVGSAIGSIRDLFVKIKAIDDKHGKFDLVLCTGDFFGPPKAPDVAVNEEDELLQLLRGELEAPIECYIMQGEYPLPEPVIEKFAKTGGQLCKSVFLLSKSGIITTAHGLRIACLGGTYDSDVFSSAEAAPGFSSPFFTTHTIERLLSNTLTQSSATTQRYTSLAAIKSAAPTSHFIDILISNVWPYSVTALSSASLPLPELASAGVYPFDDVVRRTKPRYHFAACSSQPPVFWEREPFVWENDQGRITRFVSLGAFGGVPAAGKKQRWFYAFSIAPIAPASAPLPRPPNTTGNPFLESSIRPAKRPVDAEEGENFIFGNVRQFGKRSRVAEPGKPPPGYKCRRCESSEHVIYDCPERTKPPDGYICKICNTPGHLVRDCPTKHAGDTGGRKPPKGYNCRACGSEAHYLDDCPVMSQVPATSDRRGGRRGPPKEIGPDECWFCLSNPNLAKHLIVSIGTECYVTLPKGQIVPTQSATHHTGVPGGGHVLIVPITHYPTLPSIPSDLSAPILEETDRYKSALRAMYSHHGSVAVFFEVGRISAKGGHAHVQAVPVPIKLKDKVENAFLSQGRSLGVDFEPDPDAALGACVDGRQGYFRVDLPDGRKMVHLMRDTVPFGIQFGRQVMVSLMDMPERLDWKACMLTEEEDKADTQSFKTAFASFDPTR